MITFSPLRRVAAFRSADALRHVVCISALTAAALFSAAQAAHVPNHERAGSYDVDIGVVPAEQVRLAEPQMGSAAHRGAARRGDYHVVVSLRDISSGQVVADAVVRAQVGPWV
jgi:hypothetical protein